MTSSWDVVVVGGGQAGAQTAIELRERGFGGSIAVIERQRHMPYARPPLSKEFLAGRVDAASLYFRSDEYWERQSIDFLLSTIVREVHPERHVITVSSGREIGYGRLVWAAGGRPRQLQSSWTGLTQVTNVSVLDEVTAMQASLIQSSHVVVVGGGYIGLEAAAALRSLGHSVTVVEIGARLLARVTGPVISKYFELLHRDAGVQLRLDVQVTDIVGNNRYGLSVRLSDESVIAADAVILGVGVEPNVEPLRAAGAHLSRAIEVDAYGMTSLGHVYAAGDCVCFVNPYTAGRRVCVESVQNATDLARTVAAAIAGSPEPYLKLPWFWSHQYATKFNSAGLSAGHDRALVRGDADNGSFSVLYLQGRRLLAIDTVNHTRDYVHGRWLLEHGGLTISDAMLTDLSVPLKTCLSSLPTAV